MTRVAIFEDMVEIVEMYRFAFDPKGHEIIAHATNVTDAYSLIRKIVADEVHVDAILLDANLERLDEQSPEASSVDMPLEPLPGPCLTSYKNSGESGLGADGRFIKAVLDECQLDIPTVGISSSGMGDQGIETDYEAEKHDLTGLLNILGTIDTQ